MINEKEKTGISNQQVILLVVLPYWDPLIPPLGISHLKTFLQHHGYPTVTRDANSIDVFKDIYNEYFNTMKNYILPGKRGNFYNIGHDVMRNHMMAHLNMNHHHNEVYIKLVREVIYHTFYTEFEDEQILELDDVLAKFYKELENYTFTLLREVKPGVLGISVFRDTIAPSLFMFKMTKEKFPHIKTVMGGSVFADILMVGTPNFEIFSARTPYIDKIIIGEGQNLFLKLLRGEFPQSKRVFTLRDIDGKTLGFSPLNTPDISDFNVQGDYPYLPAQGSISCPFQCGFCNVKAFFGGYRKKDPAQTANEMITFYKKYGSQLFFMCDSLLNYTAGDLAGELIKSDIRLYWDGYLRIDQDVCDIENTMLWRQGGFYRARLGVESGSPRVLELMNKKIRAHHIKSALHCLANVGIKTTTYWVIGYPGETEADFLQTLDLIEELKNYIYEAECNPFVYIHLGQTYEDQWKDQRAPLFSPWIQDVLMTQTWIVKGEPSRKEIYSRVCRFVNHCSRLGIPNPYSVVDIYEADKRWQRLHENAVPHLMDLKEKGNYIDDKDSVSRSFLMPITLEEGDFDF